jgi:SAM-dependent methyltransferase
MEDTEASPVARYWNANRDKATHPGFWMAHPACRQAINRRVSGDPHEWPLDWFRRTRAGTVFARGLSWGCGLGAFERAAIRAGLVRRIDAFDISGESLRDAERAAAEEGIAGITYASGNFNDPVLRTETYDAVFFHQSLHHVAALERLFRSLALALTPGAWLYADEYVGPSRTHWTPQELALAQAVLELLPDEAKLQGTLEFPIEADDPSEAIRSDEIPRFLRDFFDVVAWRPYGGQLADLLFPCLRAEWLESQAGIRAIGAVLAIEEDELRRDPETTHYLVVAGRLKPLHRLARPLGRQALAALRRRIGSLRRSLSSP